MNITVTVPDYTPERGIQFVWDSDFKISVAVKNDVVTIHANQAGFRSLARHFLALAAESTPEHCHMHFDDLNSLEDGSCELILEKDGNLSTEESRSDGFEK